MFVDLLSWAGTGADPLLILLVALVLDALVGDPAWLYRVVPHPIILIGRLIGLGETLLNRARPGPPVRYVLGLILTLAVTGMAAALAWAIAALVNGVEGGWIAEAVIASTLFSFRGLFDHVRATARGLDQSLEAGRAAVAKIVGRDPDSLDQGGVCRAAVESLAENFSDGVVAPAFWFALLGLPGLAAYKAVNTLDSMIGHKSEAYLHFGRFAARLDDAVNWIPARLAGSLFVAVAALLPGASAIESWRIMRRDAGKHHSPNAGWQEAAVAGALGFALAGPRQYGGEIVEDPWLGDGRHDLEAADIRAALRLYLLASLLLALIIAGLWLRL